MSRILFGTVRRNDEVIDFEGTTSIELCDWSYSAVQKAAEYLVHWSGATVGVNATQAFC